MRSQAVLPALLVFAALSPAPAQDSAPLEQRRSAMLRALLDWDQSDSNLERDAFRLPPHEVPARIDATEQKRLALDIARSRYREIFRSAANARRSLLKSGSPLSPETLLDLQRQQTADARAALALVGAQMQRLKLSDRDRREDLELNRAQLTQLLEALSRYSASLTAGSSPEVLARARASALSAELQLEPAIEVKDPADWTRAYAMLRGEVKRRAAGQAAQVASVVPMIGAAQVVVPSLAGLWVYSNPNAGKRDDVYEWKSAKADISQEGDRVAGTYECVYAVPEGEKFNPVVKFSFSGQIRSEVMIFQLRAPLKGWFQVLKHSAGEMTIAYGIENASKNGISFGEISVDSPQRLARQAR